jgi:hypothetical protein
MSGGNACKVKAHRPFWVVLQRNHNTSAFNGYRRTPSEYSEVWCTVGGCSSVWRTKAAYVGELPDVCRGCGVTSGTGCRICRRALCASCMTDHHHEGYGTPAESW